MRIYRPRVHRRSASSSLRGVARWSECGVAPVPRRPAVGAARSLARLANAPNPFPPSRNAQRFGGTFPVDHAEWGREDSNLRPKDYESSALTAELRPRRRGPCYWHTDLTRLKPNPDGSRIERCRFRERGTV